ncbi:hypothetical protein [Kineosporia babensis]|uniref:Uncharacterized protein n=1 Tax=Kineosporia babensis TaxID=499548 RepID=A0A9X1NG75_9ACTN|nr:hypothetical protein [Kineosporia babensis]MCD5313350.1 hypothetical protein [Kineosporia babensis]
MSTATDDTPPQSPPTATDELLHDIAEEAPLRDPVRRRRLLLGLGIVVLVVAVVLGGLRLGGLLGGPSEAEKDQDALVQVQERILPELRELMSQRETFLAAERLYLPAMQEAGEQARVYNRRYAAGQRRTPVPDLAEQTSDLEQVVRDTTALGTKLTEAKPGAGVTSEAHDYLLSAVHTLTRNAARNLRVLQRSRGPYVLTQVNNENALTAIKRMNKSLLYVLDAAQLPVADFDLPGGTDKHPHDHSTLM